MGEVGALLFVAHTSVYATCTFEFSEDNRLLCIPKLREESRSANDDCTIRLMEIADNFRSDRQRDDWAEPAASGWRGHLLDLDAAVGTRTPGHCAEVQRRNYN